MDFTHFSVPGDVKRFVKVIPSVDTIVNSEKPLKFDLVLEDRGVYGVIGKFSFINPRVEGNRVEYGAFLESYKSKAQVPRDLIKISVSVLEKLAIRNNFNGVGLDIEHISNLDRIKNYNKSKLKKISSYFKKNGYVSVALQTFSRTYENKVY